MMRIPGSGAGGRGGAGTSPSDPTRTLDRVVQRLTIAELGTLLENKNDELASIPGIVDWGVGLSPEWKSVVQIFISTDLDVSATERLDRWFHGQIEFVEVEPPAEAQ